MGLQCHHITAVRKEENLPIYVSSLSRLRWTRPYYLAAHPAFKDTNKQGCFHVHVAPKQKTECKKYSEVNKVTKNINSILSTLSNDKYEYYLEKLRDFETLLSSNKLINISESSFSDDSTNEGTIEQQPSLSVLKKSVEQQTENELTSTQANCELSSIKLVRPLKKQGNAKGFGQTVIGLDRGIKRKKPQIVRDDIFEHKSDDEKCAAVFCRHGSCQKSTFWAVN